MRSSVSLHLYQTRGFWDFCMNLLVSICKGSQDEEAIFLFPDPLQQLVDCSDRHGLGGQRTEAEVELKAAGHLQTQIEEKHRQSDHPVNIIIDDCSTAQNISPI